MGVEGRLTTREPPNAGGGPTWQSLLALGVVLAALFAACVALGWLVDSLLDTSPIFVLVGLALGITAACWYAVNEFRKFLKT